MSKLETYKSKLEDVKGKGKELKGEADDVLNEAGETKGTIEGLEVVDEETQNAIETGEQACDQTASELGEQEIKSPADEIGEMTSEQTEEAKEDGRIEAQNAEQLNGVGERFSDAVSGAVSSLESHSKQFEDAAEQAEAVKGEIESMAQEAVSQLESVF